MQTKWRKSLLALSLTVAIAVTAAGCSSGKQNGQETGATEGAKEGQSKEITLTIYGNGFGGSVTPGVQTDRVAQEIKKKLNINISTEAKVNDDKLNTMMASGDLPDIIYAERRHMKQLIDGNLVIPLDDLIAEHGKSVLEESPQRIEFSKKYLSNDTHNLFFIPLLAGDAPKEYTYASPGYMVRWDYYKELGYPQYNNWEDLLQILKQMQDKHPTNEKGEKVYAMAPLFEWGYSIQTEFYDRYNGKLLLDKFMDVDPETLEAKSAILEPNGSVWETARMYQKANALGLFDPDSFTMKYDNMLEKIKSNRLLFSWWNWAGTNEANDAFEKAGELKGWAPLPPAKGQTQYVGEYGSIGRLDSTFAISKNSKNPERAMELINFLVSHEGSRLIMNGIEGVDWEVKDNVPMDTAQRIEQSKADPDFGAKSGITKYYNWSGFSAGAIDPKYNVPTNFGNIITQQRLDKMNPIEKDYSKHYNISYPGELIEKLVEQGEIKKNGTDYTQFAALPIVTPDNIKRIDGKIDEYIKRMVPKLILAKDDAEFNQIQTGMMKELTGMDLQKSVDYWTDAYKKNKEVVRGN
ncbi:extracellular solute-binding protein [Paenibacillus gorillae]|uniref:extracellular solute-binding protein n=1 Tax=Paenibacillus gorillae TaxID=1243662 RepID=UPI0004B2A062|nr:extracellular solute-binding protein [Paenibacillus gorillae]